MSIGTYGFLPFLRRGAANKIAAPASAANRASLDVSLAAGDGESTLAIARSIALVGPGDVLGIGQDQIVRVEPRAWITDFEPNYLPFIEFYDEDFPWRFTPDVADTTRHRLAPWLTLLVLKDGEFEVNRTPGRPLFSVRAKAGVDLARLLPKPGQLWAFAHVQVADEVGSGAPDLPALDTVLRAHGERGVSRLLSARRLEPDGAYTAFLIPTFEVGRLAGLGLPVDPAVAGTAIAWATGTEFPIYHEWYFRTGAVGDFEDLVRRLKPSPADARVGIRPMDVRAPGFGMGAVTSDPDGVVGLEGALLAPTAVKVPLADDSNFTTAIEPIVNAPEDRIANGVDDDDPIVAPPLYGRWHALAKRLDAAQAQTRWVDGINADPRHRAAAGLGTRVIQKNQESYMKLAWAQIGEILAANRKATLTLTAMLTLKQVHAKSVAPLPASRLLALAAPLLSRIKGSPTTLRHLLDESRLTAAPLSGAFRKLVRPRGPLARRAFAARGGAGPIGAVLAAINTGKASVAPPVPPRSGGTLDDVAAGVSGNPSDLSLWLARNHWWLHLVFLLLAALVLLAWWSGLATVVAVALIAGLVALAGYVEARARQIAIGASLAPDAITPEALADKPAPDTFAVLEPGRTTPPAGTVADAATAANLKVAFAEFAALFATEPVPPAPRPAFDMVNARAKTLAATDPFLSQPRRLAREVMVGAATLDEHAARYFDNPRYLAPFPRIVPAMAYPDIKNPMYEPLRDISADILVPNIGLIPQNALSLLVTNPPFIESYMVGLNHEFGRELLWREYPTDQRPSSFRQFWDVSAYVDREGLDEKALAEKLKDIPPIHTWPTGTRLGTHDHRATESAEGRIVLVIRGDLLKRYPNTIIYAQRAKWGEAPDRQNRLILWDETGEGIAAGANDPNIRFPLFKAQILPDIHFVGFNLTLDAVRGHPDLDETAAARAAVPASALGWFFVLQEMVGEPRFGLDENRKPAGQGGAPSWNDLSWEHLGTTGAIDLDAPFAHPFAPNDPGGPSWGTQSADLATIFYQRPVLVAVHAREMLRSL